MDSWRQKIWIGDLDFRGGRLHLWLHRYREYLRGFVHLLPFPLVKISPGGFTGGHDLIPLHSFGVPLF